jgi:hypothetical protein
MIFSYTQDGTPPFDSDTLLDRSVEQGVCINLPHFAASPVARRYVHRTPIVRLPLMHKTFAAVSLYRDGEGGGAIILQTAQLRVLALDYSSDRDLDDAWQDTVKHYLAGAFTGNLAIA